MIPLAWGDVEGEFRCGRKSAKFSDYDDVAWESFLMGRELLRSFF